MFNISFDQRTFPADYKNSGYISFFLKQPPVDVSYNPKTDHALVHDRLWFNQSDDLDKIRFWANDRSNPHSYLFKDDTGFIKHILKIRLKYLEISEYKLSTIRKSSYFRSRDLYNREIIFDNKADYFRFIFHYPDIEVQP